MIGELMDYICGFLWRKVCFTKIGSSPLNSFYHCVIEGMIWFIGNRELMSSWQHTVAMYVSPFGRFDNLESCWATIRSSRCLTGSPFNQHFGWMWHRTNRWQLIWKWFPPSPSLSTAVGNTIILLSQFRREFGRGTRLKDYLTPHKSTWTLTFPFTFKHFSRRDSFPSLLVLQNNNILVCWELCTNKRRAVPLSNWNTTQRRQFGIISFEVERPRLSTRNLDSDVQQVYRFR